MNRAEQVEKALTEKTAELSGLKRQVSQMVAAIFGKSFHRLSSSLKFLCLITHHCRRLILLCYTGPRSANLNQSVVTKLKAVYTLVEQL